MNNEQLLQMYDAIRQQPDLLVKAAARKRLINFARYMQPDLLLYVVGYVRTRQNTKDDCTTTAPTWQIGGVEP